LRPSTTRCSTGSRRPRLLVDSARRARPRRMRVYGRAGGRARLGSLTPEASLPGEVPRTTYWCPSCQRSEAAR
jgi:formamidopyrimidine-DNA glycosylase